MSQSESPIILFTNDDGIRSPGFWAAVEAFRGVGRLLVAADDGGVGHVDADLNSLGHHRDFGATLHRLGLTFGAVKE